MKILNCDSKNIKKKLNIWLIENIRVSYTREAKTTLISSSVRTSVGKWMHWFQWNFILFLYMREHVNMHLFWGKAWGLTEISAGAFFISGDGKWSGATCTVQIVNDCRWYNIFYISGSIELVETSWTSERNKLQPLT